MLHILNQHLPSLPSFFSILATLVDVEWSLCNFNLQFPDDQWDWASFHGLTNHSYVFFHMVISDYFFYWVVIFYYWFVILHIFWKQVFGHSCVLWKFQHILPKTFLWHSLTIDNSIISSWKFNICMLFSLILQIFSKPTA